MTSPWLKGGNENIPEFSDLPIQSQFDYANNYAREFAHKITGELMDYFHHELSAKPIIAIVAELSVAYYILKAMHGGREKINAEDVVDDFIKKLMEEMKGWK